jgi:hypothetical protein
MARILFVAVASERARKAPSEMPRMEMRCGSMPGRVAMWVRASEMVVSQRGEVAAVGDGGGVGADRASAVEVVDGVDGDPQAGEGSGKDLEPEADVAAGSVEEEDGGEGAGGVGASGGF